MIQISNNIFKVDYNRRKELIEKSRIVSKIVEKNRPKTSWTSGIVWKISRVKSIYWIKYREHLTLEESTILSLYVIIPNDYELIKVLSNYDNNFKKVAQIYGVEPDIIKLRYANMLFMKMNRSSDLNEHKTMDQHKKMYEHKNMNEHKELKEIEEICGHKTLKLTIDNIR